MITLKQIEINDRKASAQYYPEGSTDLGFIVVDLSTGKIEKVDLAKGYEYSTAPSHARRTLVKMAETGDTRKERTVFWY